ncbi:hypothetical protein [Nonomuraea typhae]|uniref:Uncharacterized protein n=1 Tax=Nonomuraea typhae TaxID=2603600 RepID=A0ABW7YJ73_9ACTN
MNTKKASLAQEKRAAMLHGGSVNSGSGNQPWRKNDVRTPDTSWELKTTTKKQYTLKSSELIQAEKYALLDGREMRFGVEMEGRNWVVLSEEDYLVLTEKARDGSEAPG